jgi:succinyl-diaminopimelate desuccinylase
MTTVKLLKELVSIPSYITIENPHKEKLVSDFIIKFLRENYSYLKIQTVTLGTNRSNLICTGSDNPQVLLACHMDTVPPSGNDQLQLIIDGDRAIGLGTKDMKGGIAATLLSLEHITDLNKVGLIFYCDEEYGQKGIKLLTKKLPKLIKQSPKLIISPESRFNLISAARGIMLIKFRVKGKKAHSARPHLGIDAIRGSFKLVENLENQLGNLTEIGLTTFTITRINGGGLSDKNQILDNHGSIPDYTEFTLSVRNSHSNLTAPKLVALAEQKAKQLELNVESEILADYPVRNVNKKVIKSISENIEKKLGFNLEFAQSGLAGFNDADILGKAINSPVINFGPYGENNHTSEEWVSLTSIEKTAHVLAEIVNSF